MKFDEKYKGKNMDKDLLEIQKISRVTVEKKGIDISMVSVCKTIRNLAKLDRIKLDESEHRSGLNKHLFRYVEYCQSTPLEYIKEYLSNLQPYMIERRKDQEKEKAFICIIDKMYQVSVYIKLDKTFEKEIIVSFHEDNIRDVAKRNNLIQMNQRKFVPVFADSIGSINPRNGNASLKVIAQRGMKILPLTVIGIQCEDFFIVRQQDIDLQFVSYCNEYIQDLYTSNLKLDFDQIEVFSMLQQISFTSYGRDTFSSISLLIDSLVTQKDAVSRQTADFALVTFAQNLKLTKEQRDDLISLLEEKYMVTSIKSISEILFRVKTALLSEENDYQKNPFMELEDGLEQN